VAPPGARRHRTHHHRERLWERAAEDMSQKAYKALGIDLLGDARRDRGDRRFHRVPSDHGGGNTGRP
jgi:hypothetical protein